MNQVIEFFRKLFDASDWPPRWHCGHWTSFHGWLYIISDLLIWSAYFSIPLVILKYITRKQDIQFVRLYFLFAAFILACGATHFLDAVAFWIPAYRLNALMRFITGIISWITVFYLIKFLPAAFSLKSQKELEAEVEQRKKAELTVLELNAGLEQRVSERTAALQKSEQKYKHLFESNPMPMWIIELPGFRFLDVNEAAILNYGYTREEFMAMTALDIRPPEEVELFKNSHHPISISPDQYKRGMWKHRKKDGTIFPVEIVAHNILFEGKTARFILSNDVTARVEAEEALREREQLLKAIIDNSEAVIYVKNLQGQYLLVNQRFRELFHVQNKDVLNKTDYDLFSQEVAKAFRVVDERALRSEHPLTEVETVPQDEGIHTYISVKSTLPDNTGKPYAVFGISTDITQVKVVEDNLRKSLREVSDYKYALDESSIVAITDQKGKIRHVNDNFCKISKYSREELIGQDHRIINSGYHSTAFIRNLWVTIANGRIWKGEIRNKARDGSYYWVSTTIVPFLDEQGRPYQYVAIRSDITSQKLAEEALLKLNEELEQRVFLRTTQLEAVNKELEAFSYSVSHDLRAPLRSIMGYTTILEEDYTAKLDDEAKRITGIIINNTVKMGNLIDGLLAFSRMTRQDLTKTAINMERVVKEIVTELSANDKVTWNVHPLPVVTGDLQTLRQVWINLLSNAIKYSAKKEKPYIEIGSFVHEEQTAFYVKDNGAGFDNTYKDKLFRVFQRLHHYNEFEGTGVGLALVDKIISKHGGKVWADGAVDKGASFYFSLPQ